MFSPIPIITALLSAAITVEAGAQVCNGRPEYCSMIYSNVSQVGAHDSAFVGILPTQNQHDSVAGQLALGMRFFEGQTHVKNGQLEMCHTTCFEEDAGSAQQFLSSFKTFLDANPNEVVTVLLTNGDRVDPSMFDSIITASGLNQYIFTPSTGSAVLPIGDWPTLGQMIDSGKRLVFILDYGADQNRFPHILDEFSYFWETPFDTTDPNFAECDVNRGAPVAGKMYIINHFLDFSLFGIDIPNAMMAWRTNAVSGAGSITDQANRCQGIFHQGPKAVFLDYVDMGAPIAAQTALNGLH